MNSRGRARNLLLIIDPQVDFHEGGSLAVPGASADSKRTADMIKTKRFDNIMVTLDSHQYVDIGHPMWWTNEQKEQPKPFSTITCRDVEQKIWMTARRENEDWSYNYLKQLEKNNRYQHTVWPYHCIIGTPGHGVVPVLNKALEWWVRRTNQIVTFLWKGTNPKAEMYSAFKADVEVPGADETKLNVKFLDRLFRFDNIVMCGEASSHCVMYSLIDMIDYFDGKKGRKPNILLLEDCISPVTGFEEPTKIRYNDLSKRCQYLTIMNSKDLSMIDNIPH